MPHRTDTFCRRHRANRRAASGFTLIEVLIAIAIVAILTSIALPSYSAYIKRSKVPAGLDALQSYFTRMEQRFQDSGSYVSGTACAITLPTVQNYTLSCTVAGSTYTATATGTGTLSGYTYTINSSGTRTTTAHPKGLPGSNCWTIRGGSCDT